MSKVSILVIPGSFALPEFYDDIVNDVAAKGYEIRALHLPSVGREVGPREEEPSTMYEDAALIARETEKLADEGKNVMIVAHSYGGVPTTESTKGLGKEERQAQGKKGGIVRLAYMTALVPAVGVPAAGVIADMPAENQVALSIDEKGWMSQPDSAAPIVFSDLPSEEGEAWIKKFPRHSAVSFGNELTHAGYKDIPVSYLLCEEDKCVPPKIQRAGIELIEKESGKKVDVTSVNAGHCPIISKRQETVDWVLDTAKKS